MKTYLALTLLICGLTPLAAQPISDTSKVYMDYSKAAKLEIGGLEVIGNQYSDGNSIIAVSGLKVGQNLELPGQEIPRAVRALWKLKLFTDVEIFISKKIGDIAFLTIKVEERPRLSRYSYKGVKKAVHDELNGKIENYMLRGSIISENMKTNAASQIRRHFVEKGFLNTEVSTEEVGDTLLTNSARVVFNIKTGKRVRISDVVFEGNEEISDAKLRRLMKKTKRKRWYTIFSSSKFIKKEYEADKEKVLAYYNKMGHRDAQILSDSIWQPEPNKVAVAIRLTEGRVYHFRNIVFKGNVIYPTDQIAGILGIEKGDVYNQELLETRLNFDPAGRDIATLYMDNGYLFFRATPVEVSVENDSIDLEIRIVEGPQATIDKVIVSGNTRTHEHVIRRELRTKPGQKFSRSDIIRSQREILALNYFNPEGLQINTPVDPNKGTVDIEYVVEERPSDQLEMSAGWGGRGRGIIGTLGVTFNNFSVRNLFNGASWSPLPQGDGQRLSVRVQTNGRFFQSYNVSFTEPWLGGNKPNSLTVVGFHNRQSNGYTSESSRLSQVLITGASVSLGRRLRFPDDFFTSSTGINLQQIDLVNAGQSYGFSINNGDFINLSLTQTFARNSIDNPTFPQSGSRFVLTTQFTPPYSLFSKKNYAELDEAERFRFVEYFKINFRAEWYTRLVGKLTLKAGAKTGYLGFYNKDIGLSPFERFELGGDGLQNFNGIIGKEIISMRGYESSEVSTANSLGAAIFNKYTLELRYPISLNPTSTVYVLSFLEGGNAWARFKDYDPFDLRRTAGLGVRVFLPMFGTLGFDYGIGFDNDRNGSKNLFEYGNFNIILGFEPE